ncbi:hypothetical protein SFR_0378 [Streptomyces sp. FR-008]|nr:hypothetical protein SFR_0378 [Streptomyces sp. FR-008]
MHGDDLPGGALRPRRAVSQVVMPGADPPHPGARMCEGVAHGVAR